MNMIRMLVVKLVGSQSWLQNVFSPLYWLRLYNCKITTKLYLQQDNMIFGKKS